MILGIDVGGTHTDAVLIEDGFVSRKAKVSTRPDNIFESLMEATLRILNEEDFRRLERVVLSTTLSTNAIVQNRIDRVGMILPSGPGMAPDSLPIDKERYIVSGYINHRGVEVAPISADEIIRICRSLHGKGIRHLGIVGKFSTRNPEQELAIHAMIKESFDHISLGHRMSGHLGFPRRISTTYLNAAVFDTHLSFAEAAGDFWGSRGRDIPVHILKADGGTCSLEKSVELPVQTILSGPAASIMGILGLSDCRMDAVAVDVGGTTTDISVLAEGVPLLEPRGVTIGGLKTLIRGLRTRSLGVGGDSEVRFENGELHIGPQRNGPASAFGGSDFTPTDAMILLGFIKGGDREKAYRALVEIARSMDLSPLDAAEKIFDHTCRLIAQAIRGLIREINSEPVYTIHEILEGRAINPQNIYVVGGPAGPVAERLSDLLDIPAEIPPHAEVANAVGAALARTTAEITVLADTEIGMMTIVEDGLRQEIPNRFSRQDAHAVCRERLGRMARAMGAMEDDMEIQIVEDQEFNMVRGYYTAGKNIRVKAQIKPGLIAGFGKGRRIQ